MKTYPFPTNHQIPLSLAMTAKKWLPMYYRLMHGNFRQVHKFLHIILTTIGLMGTYIGIRLDWFQVIEFVLGGNDFFKTIWQGIISAPGSEMMLSTLLFAPCTLNIVELGFDFYKMKDGTTWSLIEMLTKCMELL